MHGKAVSRRATLLTLCLLLKNFMGNNAHTNTCAYTRFMGHAWTLICFSWDKPAKPMLESGALLVITFKKFSESGKCTTAGYSEGDSESSVCMCVIVCVVVSCEGARQQFLYSNYHSSPHACARGCVCGGGSVVELPH